MHNDFVDNMYVSVSGVMLQCWFDKEGVLRKLVAESGDPKAYLLITLGSMLTNLV